MGHQYVNIVAGQIFASFLLYKEIRRFPISRRNSPGMWTSNFVKKFYNFELSLGISRTYNVESAHKVLPSGSENFLFSLLPSLRLNFVCFRRAAGILGQVQPLNSK